MLTRETAETIVSEVVVVVQSWQKVAIRLGISKREMDMFAGVLDERFKVSVFTVKKHISAKHFFDRAFR